MSIEQLAMSNTWTLARSSVGTFASNGSARAFRKNASRWTLGTDRSYVGRVERGTENVTLDRLDAFAAVLNVTVAQLLREPIDGTDAGPVRGLVRKPKR